MSHDTGLAAVVAATNAVSKADHDAALVSAQATGNAEGAKLGAVAERERCKAILSAKESKGREEMAQHLAFETDMAADAAIALLNKSPAKAEVPKTPSAPAARLVPQPNVSADSGEAPNAQAGWHAALEAVNGKRAGAAR